MIVRIAALIALAYLIGLAWFALFLPQPAPAQRTQGIVVLTGGKGRIERGLALLEQGGARRMLISGVDRDVRPRELAALHGISPARMACCIALGREAIDTRSNAIETARWIDTRNYESVRLITSDWHMRRALYELSRNVPPTVTIIADAVPTQPTLDVYVREYNKFVLRRAAGLIGI